MKVQEALPVFHAHNIDVVGVSFSPPDRIRWLQSEFNLSFPILHDPDRDWYEVSGAKRGGWSTVFSPSILRRYVTLIWRGYHVRYSGEDLRQLGADLLLQGDQVLRRWVTDESEQRPPAEEVIAAARR